MGDEVLLWFQVSSGDVGTHFLHIRKEIYNTFMNQNEIWMELKWLDYCFGDALLFTL